MVGTVDTRWSLLCIGTETMWDGTQRHEGRTTTTWDGKWWHGTEHDNVGRNTTMEHDDVGRNTTMWDGTRQRRMEHDELGWNTMVRHAVGWFLHLSCPVMFGTIITHFMSKWRVRGNALWRHRFSSGWKDFGLDAEPCCRLVFSRLWRCWIFSSCVFRSQSEENAIIYLFELTFLEGRAVPEQEHNLQTTIQPLQSENDNDNKNTPRATLE